MTGVRVGVVICSRDRPQRAMRTLEALGRQSDPEFDLVVVLQGDHGSWKPERSWPGGLAPARCRVIRDAGAGVSRARNIGYRALDADWIVYLDDDCVPADDWMAAYKRAIADQPEASMISGDVREHEARPAAEYVRVSVPRVDRERIVGGRFARPWEAGLGVNFGVARRAIEELGGFDERLGPGAGDLAASEDMDLNYRLLRSGRTAFVTPAIRAVHEQWRSPAEVIGLWRGYARGWAGMSMKQLRRGDIAGALWLWPFGLRNAAGMAWSAIRLRSTLRARVAWAMLRGHLAGTFVGMSRRW